MSSMFLQALKTFEDLKGLENQVEAKIQRLAKKERVTYMSRLVTIFDLDPKDSSTSAAVKAQRMAVNPALRTTFDQESLAYHYQVGNKIFER